MKIFSTRYIGATLAVMVVGTLFAVTYLLNPGFLGAPRAEATATDNVSGWVWSENIGWISFNSTDNQGLCDANGNGYTDAACGGLDTAATPYSYGVRVDTTTKAAGGVGAITGNAWGEHVGWVSFDRARTGNPPSDDPGSGSGRIAQVDWNTGSTTGWMRVLSAMDTPPFGSPTWQAPALTAGPLLTPPNDAAQAIDINGNYVYLGGDSRLAIVNVANPANPVQVSSFNYAVLPNPPSWGQEATDVRYHAIGGTPLVFMTTYFGGLIIIDVTNPAAPVLRGAVALSQEVWAVDFSADDKYAFVSGANGLQVVDIQDTANPLWKTTLALPGAMGNGVVVVGNYAYVAGRAGGLRVVNISNPLALSVAGSYTTGFNANGWAFNVSYASPYLYLAKHAATGAQENSKVLIFDIATDPTSPALVQSIEIPLVAQEPTFLTQFDRGPRSVRVVGNLMFVPSSRAGLYVYDISNIASPVMLGIFRTPYSGNAWEVVVKDGKVYLADETNDLFVVEPSVGPWWDGWIKLSGNVLDTDPYIPPSTGIARKTPYSVKVTGSKFGGWAWGSNVVGWVDFAPKIGGISVGPVIGVPPCIAADVPVGSWGLCQPLVACPTADTTGIQVGLCTAGGTVTRACTTAARVCASAPAGPAGSCGDGVCSSTENPLSCSQDCKFKFRRF